EWASVKRHNPGLLSNTGGSRIKEPEVDNSVLPTLVVETQGRCQRSWNRRYVNEPILVLLGCELCSRDEEVRFFIGLRFVDGPVNIDFLLVLLGNQIWAPGSEGSGSNPHLLLDENNSILD
ncbi:hypothetical protein, partial [Candidatus Microthrix parvicella]|uniref:hypothetical protein n=1 Tax=Candidatus Neomicrothrix parvicella TaxID=41950 RepID=UPI001F1B8E4A